MKLLALIPILFLVTGCVAENKLPTDLYKAKHPITLVLVNKEGILLRDGDGKLYVYDETFYLAQVIIESNIENGTILTE